MSLEAKIRELVEAERALAQITDAQGTVTILDIKTYWEDSCDLEAQRLILIETLRTIESSQASINGKLIACEQRRKNLSAAQEKFNSDWNAYMKSGLFGGEPALFKGKKAGLLFRKESLTERFAVLHQDKNILEGKQSALRATYSRAQADCADFIRLVQASLRKTMNSIVNESRNTAAEGFKAAGHLADCEWLQKFALRVRDTDVWSLVDEANSDAFLKHAASGTHLSLERLKSIVEIISDQEWRIAIRKPIPPPAHSPDPTAHKNTPPKFKTVESRTGGVVWSLLGILGVLLTIAVVYLIGHNRAINTIPAQSSTQSVPAIPTATLQQPAANDASLISSQLNSDGLSVDGNMLDVPDATSGSTLHAVSAVCSKTDQVCRKFFVFLGSGAVWNEDIDAASSVQLVSSADPDKFSLILTSLGTDGLQQRATVDYAWDGKSISRTVEGPVTQSATDNTSSTPQFSSSSQVPITPQPMPAAIPQPPASTVAPKSEPEAPMQAPQRTPTEIYSDIQRAFAPLDYLKNVRVGYPQEQEVFLSGYVPNEAAKELAEINAKRVEGVFAVHNAIVISQDVQPQRGTYLPNTINVSQRSDNEINADVNRSISETLYYPRDKQISVITVQHEVTLSGTVPNEITRDTAESLAGRIPGVTAVHNNIRVLQIQSQGYTRSQQSFPTAQTVPPDAKLSGLWRSSQSGSIYRIDITDSYVTITPVAGTGHIYAHVPIKVDKSGKDKIMGQWQSDGGTGFISITEISDQQITATMIVPHSPGAICTSRTASFFENMSDIKQYKSVEVSWHRQ